MPCRVRWHCSTSIIPLLTVLLLIETVGCGKNSSTATNNSNAPAAFIEADPEFRVPDGKSEKILEFMRELSKRRPKPSNPQETVRYAVKIQQAIIRGADKILTQASDDETLKEAMTRKLKGTILLAANGAGDSAENVQAEVDRLRRDKRPVVAEVANHFWIAARVLNFDALSADERTQLADEAIESVVSSKSSPDSISDVMFMADRFLNASETGTAAALYDRLADAIANSTYDEKTRSMVPQLRGKSATLRLPGSQLEIEGKLLSGVDFDWESYRGKVVLVDFWATWCGPCMGELPNVRANYSKYHDRGFDVVGISLDRDRQALEKVVLQEAFPWAQLFDDTPKKGREWQHPMALRYGVTSIPAAFLVDRNGKVVSTNARGEELERLITPLLETGTNGGGEGFF